MRRVAEHHQLFAISHLPQLAARAHHHILVAKGEDKRAANVTTRVQPLDAGRRREEIARMLAGATITDEARAAAERLILGAA